MVVCWTGGKNGRHLYLLHNAKSFLRMWLNKLEDKEQSKNMQNSQKWNKLLLTKLFINNKKYTKRWQFKSNATNRLMQTADAFWRPRLESIDGGSNGDLSKWHALDFSDSALAYSSGFNVLRFFMSFFSFRIFSAISTSRPLCFSPNALHVKTMLKILTDNYQKEISKGKSNRNTNQLVIVEILTE